jgi:acetyl esterase/lipase
VGLGNAAVSSQVQAVVSWYGPGDFAAMDAQARQVGACAGRAPAHDDAASPESRWLGAPVQTAPLVRASNPIAWLPSARTASLPSFLLVHGSVDCVVPSGQSTQLGQALTAAGAPVQVEIVDGAGHADDALHRRMLGPTLDFIATALRHRTPG